MFITCQEIGEPVLCCRILLSISLVDNIACPKVHIANGGDPTECIISTDHKLSFYMSSEGGEVGAGASNQKTEIFRYCYLLTTLQLQLRAMLRLLKMSQPFPTMCLADADNTSYCCTKT